MNRDFDQHELMHAQEISLNHREDSVVLYPVDSPPTPINEYSQDFDPVNDSLDPDTIAQILHEQMTFNSEAIPFVKKI